MLAVTLLIASMAPAENVLRDNVAVIELNHFHDEQGRLVFKQYIYWDWDSDKWRGGVHYVVDWRLAKTSSMLPRRIAGGGFVQIWIDHKRLREIKSLSFSQTWTMHDPEMLEREKLPKEFRRGLSE